MRSLQLTVQVRVQADQVKVWSWRSFCNDMRRSVREGLWHFIFFVRMCRVLLTWLLMFMYAHLYMCKWNNILIPFYSWLWTININCEQSITGYWYYFIWIQRKTSIVQSHKSRKLHTSWRKFMQCHFHSHEINYIYLKFPISYKMHNK